MDVFSACESARGALNALPGNAIHSQNEPPPLATSDNTRIVDSDTDSDTPWREANDDIVNKNVQLFSQYANRWRSCVHLVCGVMQGITMVFLFVSGDGANCGMIYMYAVVCLYVLAIFHPLYLLHDCLMWNANGAAGTITCPLPVGIRAFVFLTETCVIVMALTTPWIDTEKCQTRHLLLRSYPLLFIIKFAVLYKHCVAVVECRQWVREQRLRGLSFWRLALGMSEEILSKILAAFTHIEYAPHLFDGILHSKECCICQNEFNSDSDIVETECKHVFDRDCIVRWLKAADVESSCTCPLCRHDLSSSKLEV